MDSSSQFTIAYMLYYIKFTALSIKTICITLTLFVFRYQQFSEGRYLLFFNLI